MFTDKTLFSEHVPLTIRPIDFPSRIPITYYSKNTIDKTQFKVPGHM